MAPEAPLDVPRETPGRGLDRALTLAALVALGLHAALDVRVRPRATLAVALCTAALALVAARSLPARSRSARASPSICALAACLTVSVQTGLVWQGSMLLALAAYAVLGKLFPAIRPPEGWLGRGRLRWGAIALVGGVTPGALTAWLALAHPDLRDITGSELLKVPFPVLVAGGVLFAFLNATLEETVWRGIFQRSLTEAWGPRAAVAIQALSFGAQHAHGFPRGLLGVGLAGAWGVMLGALRLYAGGLLAPVLAHVVADATIAILVIARLQA